MTAVEHQKHTLQTLRANHAALEAQLAEEQSHRFPDTTKISRLKRQKLYVKDRLEGIGRGRQLNS